MHTHTRLIESTHPLTHSHSPQPHTVGPWLVPHPRPPLWGSGREGEWWSQRMLTYQWHLCVRVCVMCVCVRACVNAWMCSFERENASAHEKVRMSVHFHDKIHIKTTRTRTPPSTPIPSHTPAVNTRAERRMVGRRPKRSATLPAINAPVCVNEWVCVSVKSCLSLSPSLPLSLFLSSGRGHIYKMPV